MYIVNFRPYNSKVLNWAEMFNEFGTLTLQYLFIVFMLCDAVTAPKPRWRLGNFYISVVIINYAINFVIVLMNLFLKARLLFKRHRHWIIHKEYEARKKTWLK